MTTGAIRRAKLQSNRHHQQTDTQLLTGRMPFLSPNKQCQSTEWRTRRTQTTGNVTNQCRPPQSKQLTQNAVYVGRPTFTCDVCCGQQSEWLVFAGLEPRGNHVVGRHEVGHVSPVVVKKLIVSLDAGLQSQLHLQVAQPGFHAATVALYSLTFTLEMGKNPEFWADVRFGLFGGQGSGSEYFQKIRFEFVLSSVNVGFGFGSVSSPMELERCFRGGHLLRINCICKYQLIG